MSTTTTKEIIYLDNAATTPLHPQVAEEMREQLLQYGNASSIHSVGRRARTLIEMSRVHLAKHLGVSPSEIVFTSGGTEANNTILKGLVMHHEVQRIITSRLEHPSIHNTMKCPEFQQVEWVQCPNHEDGSLNLEALHALLTTSEAKTLVSVIHGHNELGTINDIRAIGKICSDNNALFHTDTVQSMAKQDINLKEAHVNFATSSAHKYHGPKGVGFFFIDSEHRLSPLITGGGQERGMRSGTESSFLIHAMSTAFDLYSEHRVAYNAHCLDLKQRMWEGLKATIPNLRLNGRLADSLPQILNIGFPSDQFNEMLIMNLDMAQICCSAGSACSSGSLKASRIMTELHGADDPYLNLRFSFSPFNTRDEIDTTVDLISKIAQAS